MSSRASRLGSRLGCCAAALTLVACATPPCGLPAAQRALADGDLITALVALDRVAPAAPDYAQARTLAAAVERRMRVGQRLLASGLELRAQWLDDEAVGALRAARQVWPSLPGLAALIDTTAGRIVALRPREVAAEPPEIAVATTRPIDLPATPDVEPAAPAPARLAARQSDEDSQPAAPRDPVAESLAAIRAGLRDSGDLEAGLEQLQSLHTRNPARADVTALLVDLLHRRALRLYGSGELLTAIAHWERARLLAPQHDVIPGFLRAARTELERR
ncbi:MAG: hypothetical protein IPM29_21865 [Planctomycetes bacterium]|nr:hypothetical protein [Planctomycetota bacterium]